MFKKMFGKESETKNAKIVTLDKKELKNVLGGGDPVPGLDVNLEQRPGGIIATGTSAGATPTTVHH